MTILLLIMVEHTRDKCGWSIWGLATLRAILRQPAYTGQLFAGRAR